METKQFTTNTNYIDVMDIDLYGGRLAPDYIFEYHDRYNNDNDFNINEYREFLTKHFGYIFEDAFKSILKEIEIDIIKIDNWYTPKEYNSQTDSLDITFGYSENSINLLIEFLKSNNNNEFLNGYMKEKFASHSGFVSFCPQSINEVKIDLEIGNNIPRALAIAILLYIIHAEEGELGYLSEKLQEAVYTEFDYADYEDSKPQI